MSDRARVPKSVPRVDSIVVVGLDLWFNSHDHLPPHFHAEKPGDWAVRVHFLRDPSVMCEVVYTRRPRRPTKKELKALVTRAEANREQLLQEWERKVSVQDPGASQ